MVVPLKEPPASSSTTVNAKPRPRKKPRSNSITESEARLDDVPDDEGPAQPKKSRTTPAYFPKPRDGAWGILAALYSFCEPADQKKFNTRETIIEHAQKYCDLDYVTTAAGGPKPAWSSAMYVSLKSEFLKLDYLFSLRITSFQ